MTPPDPNSSLSGDGEDRERANALDVELMGRIRDGDYEAFARLVEIHQRSVIGTVAKMLGSPTEAEDIAQQVFIRIWKSAARYEPQAKFTTWLFTITRNLVFNEVRRRQRKPTVSVQEREETTHRVVEDVQGASPDEELLRREMEAAIDRAIEALPEKQRLAVVLRRYEEMPYEEIGAVLAMSVPAVKSLLFRARTQLKESLEKYLRE